MSSIIFLEPKERNRLARRWKEQVKEMADKLEILKKEAKKLGAIELEEDIEYQLKNLKNEFAVMFRGASNETIIKEMDLKYWDAAKVNDRLRILDEEINKLDLKIKEKIFEKEILKKQVPALKEKINKYNFLKHLNKELNNIENLTLEEMKNLLNKIENEINSKLDTFNKVKNTKSALEATIQNLKENINQYSFLEDFNKDLNILEENLKEIKDLEMNKLNELITKFNNLKTSIENKQNKVLHSIEAIKEYKILQEELKEIDNIINTLNIKNRKKEIEKEKIQIQYNEFIKKLEFYSSKEAERIKKLNIPLENKLLELKLTYQQEKKKYLIKTKLEEIKEKYKNDKEFIKNFSQKIENVISNAEEYEFYNLLFDIDNYNTKQKIIKEQISLLKEKLEKMGYKFQNEIKIGEKGYINTDDKKLKIKYFFDDKNINFVFVRMGKNNLSYDEEQRTLNKAKKWCNDFDKLNEELKKEGLELFDETEKDTLFRKEPQTIKDIVFEEIKEENEEELEESINLTQEKYIEEN
jgi:hypothetical protein